MMSGGVIYLIYSYSVISDTRKFRIIFINVGHNSQIIAFTSSGWFLRSMSALQAKSISSRRVIANN